MFAGAGGETTPVLGTARILREDKSALGQITKSYVKEQDDVRFLYPQLAQNPNSDSTSSLIAKPASRALLAAASTKHMTRASKSSHSFGTDPRMVLAQSRE